jgi:hypothetical protein
MLYSFFWVIPWHLNFVCRRFGTLCLFLLQRRVLPAYEDGTDSVPKHWHIKFRRRGIARKENIQHYDTLFQVIPHKFRIVLLNSQRQKICTDILSELERRQNTLLRAFIVLTKRLLIAE